MIAAEKNGEPVLAARLWADAEEAERQGRDKDEWLKENRTGFICAVCGKTAIFVSPGTGRTGGNPAHFRVKGASSCNNHSASESAERAKGDPAQKEGIINVGGLVTVRYDGLAGSGGAGVIPDAGEVIPDGGVARVRYVDGGGTPNNRESAGLKAFLSDLQSMPKFPPSTLRLNVIGYGQVWGRDYFCRFQDAQADHAAPLPETGQARLMAYWGEVDWANLTTTNLFLNGDGMSVMVWKKDIEAVKNAMGVEKFEDVKGQGWYVIAEGRLEPNRFDGFHVKVPNLSRMAFLKPKP